jgi:hypothetical protein
MDAQSIRQNLMSTRPWFSLALCTMLTLPGLLGLWLMRQPSFQMDDGFVLPVAPSRREVTAQKEFFGAKVYHFNFSVDLFQKKKLVT